MVTEPLDRSVLSHMHHQLIILDEDTDAATAVKLMHDKKAETIIVKNKNDEHVGIITDSDILDKIVMRGEDSDQVSNKDNYVFSNLNNICKGHRETGFGTYEAKRSKKNTCHR